MRLISFTVEKFPAPMINLLWLFAVSCASYLLFVPGTTRNFPPGEAGGENVFAFVPDEAHSPMRRWCFAINWLEDVTEGLLPHTAFRQLFLFIISSSSSVVVLLSLWWWCRYYYSMQHNHHHRSCKYNNKNKNLKR